MSPAAAASSTLGTWATSLGLAVPPVPAPFAGRLRQIGDHVFTTRSDGERPYNVGRLVAELEAGPVEDYLLLGADGHGMSSWALHWHCVQGPAAVLVQVHWGGVDTQDTDDADRAADVLQRADALRRRLVTSATAPAGRLDIVAADLSRSGVWSRAPDREFGGGVGALDTLEFAELLLDDLVG